MFPDLYEPPRPRRVYDNPPFIERRSLLAALREWSVQVARRPSVSKQPKESAPRCRESLDLLRR